MLLFLLRGLFVNFSVYPAAREQSVRVLKNKTKRIIFNSVSLFELSGKISIDGALSPVTEMARGC